MATAHSISATPSIHRLLLSARTSVTLSCVRCSVTGSSPRFSVTAQEAKLSVLGGTDNSLTGIEQDRADLVGDPFNGSCSNGAPVGSQNLRWIPSAFVTNAAGTMWHFITQHD